MPTTQPKSAVVMLSLITSRCWAFASRLAADERGFSAVLTGIAATVLLGFGGLAVDVGYWQWNQRNMQGAADQAAFAAATIAHNGSTTAVATTTAKGITAAMGFADGSNSVTVTVNNPPSYGTYNTDADAWEVIITQPQPMWLASAIPGMTAPTASGRAVARLNTIPACVIALKPSGQDTVTAGGGGSEDFSDCDIVVNSSDSKALETNGSTTILAKDAYIVGNYHISGGGGLTVSGTLKTGATAVTDPYASRTAPTVGACGANPLSPSGGGSASAYNVPSGGVTVYPGVYCGGISVSSGATFAPGIYIINGGNLSIGSGSTSLSSGGVCSGSGGYINAPGGVTIYMVPNGATTGTFDIKGCISITAPTTGNTAGMAIWVDHTQSSAGTDDFAAGANSYIVGTVYDPVHQLAFSGGANTSNCTQLIAYTISFSGGPQFRHTCGGTGVSDPTAAGSQLVQ